MASSAISISATSSTTETGSSALLLASRPFSVPRTSSAAEIGLSGIIGAAAILVEGSVNALSSSRFSLILPEIIVSVTGSSFAGLGNKPNPERSPLNAIWSAFRHHGIAFSAIYIFLAAYAGFHYYFSGS
jgi:hypothetical protein